MKVLGIYGGSFDPFISAIFYWPNSRKNWSGIGNFVPANPLKTIPLCSGEQRLI